MEYGAIAFHKAVLETTSGWTQFVLDVSSVGMIERKGFSKEEREACDRLLNFIYMKYKELEEI